MAMRYLKIGPIGLAAATITTASLLGCQSDAKFSEKEMQQFKEGPPKEMPAEARKMFEEAAKAGRGPGGPGGPPAAAQQPSGK